MSKRNTATAQSAPSVGPGAKEVTRTTTERFREPIIEANAQARPPADVAVICSDCQQPSLQSAWDDNGGDCPKCGQDTTGFRFENDQPEPSSIDNLLASFGASGGADGVSIYVKRKPDPLGMVFAIPCQTEVTVGELPYDESFTTLAALEIAIQNNWGGGRYQIQVLRNGRYEKAKTVTIADPQKVAEQPTPAAAAPVAPAADPIDAMFSTVKRFADIGKEMGWDRGGQAPVVQPALPPAPAPDPMDTVQKTFAMLTQAKSLTESFGGGGSGNGKGSLVRDVLSGGAEILRELGADKFVPELVKMGTALAMSRQAAPVQPPPASTVPPAPAPAALPPIAPAPAPPEPQPHAAAPEGLSSHLEYVLDKIVTELWSWSNESDEALSTECLDRAADALQTLPANELAEMMVVPPASLAVWLSTLRSGWAEIAETGDGANFFFELKKIVNARLVEEHEHVPGEVVQFPSAPSAAPQEGSE